MKWQLAPSPKSKKAKIVFSAANIMVSFLWGTKEVLNIDKKSQHSARFLHDNAILQVAPHTTATVLGEEVSFQ